MDSKIQYCGLELPELGRWVTSKLAHRKKSLISFVKQVVHDYLLCYKLNQMLTMTSLHNYYII